ncbi:MAG: hypothetical protein HZA46_11135, partial [Planctomycetales bacterium]|nr:hypothetical protein [Planctomycetales bacterium]
EIEKPVENPLPWELRPYRCRVEVFFGNDAELSAAFCHDVTAELAACADRFLGQMWTVEVREDEWLRPASEIGLRRIDVAALPADLATSELDKLFLLTVESRGGAFRLAGREWDATAKRLDPVVARTAIERSGLPRELFSLLRELFQPIYQLESKDPLSVSAVLRGGHLNPSDPDCFPLRSGQFLQPFYRILNRDLRPDKLQFIPWTLVQIDKVDQARGAGKVLSGLRVPLAAKKKRRIEPLAIALRPQSTSTDVTLVTRPPDSRPLVGLEIDVLPAQQPKVEEGQAPPPPLQRLYSNRRGSFSIVARPDHPFVWLRVRSGQHLLARLPFVPGLTQTLSADLPDDSVRLSVEGSVSLIQADLVDLVARRALLMAGARQFAKAKQFENADAALKQLGQLPSTETFNRELLAVQQTASEAARKQKDRATEQRIKKLSDETGDLIKTYLDGEKLRALQEEIAELKMVDKEDQDDLKKLEEREKRQKR